MSLISENIYRFFFTPSSQYRPVSIVALLLSGVLLIALMIGIAGPMLALAAALAS